jgi:hypothetical protein
MTLDRITDMIGNSILTPKIRALGWNRLSARSIPLHQTNTEKVFFCLQLVNGLKSRRAHHHAADLHSVTISRTYPSENSLCHSEQ